VPEFGEGIQWPKERKPIFFMVGVVQIDGDATRRKWWGGPGR
jgi:hypothetical protein